MTTRDKWTIRNFLAWSSNSMRAWLTDRTANPDIDVWDVLRHPDKLQGLGIRITLEATPLNGGLCGYRTITVQT